jgi:hypothetical protein
MHHAHLGHLNSVLDLEDYQQQIENVRAVHAIIFEFPEIFREDLQVLPWRSEEQIEQE